MPDTRNITDLGIHVSYAKHFRNRHVGFPALKALPDTRNITDLGIHVSYAKHFRNRHVGFPVLKALPDTSNQCEWIHILVNYRLSTF